MVGIEGDLQVPGRILVQPGTRLRVHAGDPRRRVLETVTFGIFADRSEDFPDRSGNSLHVDRRCRLGRGRIDPVEVVRTLP